MQALPKALAEDLLPWYRQNRRPLPWRENSTPYRVWISEIMLQQTRIETVKDYFSRFMAVFPTVQALAEAPEERVLKLWEGLGYYSRARNLHKTARMIVSEYGGQFPADVRALRSLPGIGRYTAGAIASLAFDLPEPAVDGNVLRLCTRLVCCGESIGSPAVRSAVEGQLRGFYCPGQCGDFTSALMELGETVCLPGTPDCDSCPLRGLCMAFRSGRQTEFPVMPDKRERKVQSRTVFLLLAGDLVALNRRPDRGLLAGLWEFPNREGTLSEEQALRMATEWGCQPRAIAPCGEAVHIFTHLQWNMSGWRLACDARGGTFTWATVAELKEKYSLPSAFRAYKNLLLKA